MTDYSVDCNGPVYQSVQVVSTIFIVAYGVGIPLAFILLGTFLNRSPALVPWLCARFAGDAVLTGLLVHA